jgi:tRNA(Ile)-lysidine synthase
MTGTAPPSAAAEALPPDLVRRFAEALARLNPGRGRIGLAVSGGPDSVAMLLLAHATIPGEFEVATVDHGLRSAAADECALVERACVERDIACLTLRVEVGEGNLQAKARFERYFALGCWAEERDLVAIATAHHADDQAETLLMRLNRGSGVAGLAGVREDGFIECCAPIGLIRPLLRFRRAELAAVVSAANIEVARDPSNLDDRFDRVRIRKALANADWIDPLAVAESASHLADAEEALANFARYLRSERVSLDDFTAGSDRVYRYQPLDGPEMVLRLVGGIIADMGGQPRGSEVAALIARLNLGQNGNLAGVLATVEGDEWVFRPEPPRRT